MPTAELVTWEREKEEPEHWHAQTKFEDVELKAEIERAKTILDLTEDWDGNGSPAYSKETLDRAVAFLNMHSSKSRDLCAEYPPVPRIGPGPSGSIDLHWKQDKWELLVNVPADNTQMAVFYGDDYGTAKIKGSFDLNTVNLGIVAWLTHK